MTTLADPSFQPPIQTLQGVSLYLVGMMGAGKTTVGQILAQQLKYQFFDTDTLIEQVSGSSIPKIFQQQGESEFRDLESQVLSELSSYTRLVVATGGGIIQRSLNWSYLHHGVVIWLDVSFEQLYERLILDPTPRPLLQTEDPRQTLQILLDQRRPYYAQADIHVHVDSPTQPEILATLILERVLRQLKIRDQP